MEQDDSYLGPFSRAQMSRATLGPFAMPHLLEEQKPLHEDFGLGRDDVRKVLATHPEFKELLTEPEADGLRAYLDGTEKYDVGVLNGMVMELLDGMKARKAAKPAQRPRRSLSRRPSGPPGGFAGPTSGLVLPRAPAASAGAHSAPPYPWWLEKPGK